jgi:two-component system response regulator HydG
MGVNASPPNILVIDDEQEMCELVATDLTRRGHRVSCYTSAKEGLAALESTQFVILLVDLQMAELSGLELCRAALSKRPDLVVLVMTGFGSMEQAVGAIRAGAYDFITKPISMDLLALTLERALRQRSLRDELESLRRRVYDDESPNLVSESPLMQQVSDLVARIAGSDTSVLVTGESGSGKELVARALHAQSGRKGAFVAVNCAAIPETLLESELFGHVRGAFTDARSDRAGLFTEANGGTLFLDEIGEMPLATQGKLLRALQERKLRPVGASREISFDSRLITATNCDLEYEVEQKRFREDLYYRINVLQIEVPPLRSRGNDILLLAQFFLERAARRGQTPCLRISPAVAECFVNYDWPGNVRELENCIDRVVALSRYEELTLDDLPQKLREPRPSQPATTDENPEHLPSMATVEARYLRKVLSAVEGNKTLAAKILKVDIRTLQRKLAEPHPVADPSA